MLNKVLDNQAEQIAVTPDQAAYVLKNKAEFKNKVDVDVSMYNTNIANSYINNTLAENPDWNKYLSDPLRRSNPNYKRWKSVEDLMSDENYVSIAKKYGDDLAKQSDIVLDYVKPKSGLERVIMGYNAARYGLRYADARKELSDAMEEGDDAKIAQAQQNLQKELFNLQYNSDEFDSKYWQSASSIAASVARNIPAMIASDVATSVGMGLVGGPLTAGASLVTKWGARAAKLGRATKITAESIGAARKAIKTAQAIKGVKAVQKATEFAKGAAKAGIVFGDTYKVESGSILLELDQSHPNLSEDRKRDLAEAGGIINATIETIPMLAGVGFQAGMSKLLSKATSNAMVKTGVTAKMVKDPAFLKEFAKQIEKNSAKFKFKQFAGEVAADMATNSIQEVLQDCISKAAVYAADNPDTSILAQGLETFADFVSNPLSERNADLWDTFVNTALASPMFSGGMSLGGMAIDAVSGSGSMWKKAAGAKNNSTLAEKLNKWNKESEVGKVSPETVNQNLANLVKNGDAPATVTFDSVAIKEALESADKEVQEAMAKLDMARRYEESKDNGGMIEMTLPEYNELVNQESTGKLFQIVRSMVSFDPNSLSQSEFLRYMTTDGKAMSVLEDAVADKESAYNKSYEKFIAAGWDEKQARYEATMAQLVSDRLAKITNSGLTGSQYFAKNIDVRTGLDQPSVAELKDTLQQFVGSRTEQTVNQIADTLGKRAELEEARAMEKESIDKGVMPDYEAIWEKTGWYKEPDTSWSYEISDDKASLKPGTIVGRDGKMIANITTTLGEALDHPQLFEIFPQFKDMPLIIGSRRTKNTAGGYSPSKNNITLYPASIEDEVRSYKKLPEAIMETLMHEVQHAIQKNADMMRYNFAESAAEIKNPKLKEEQKQELKKLDDLQSQVVTMAIDSGKLPRVHRMSPIRTVFSYRNELLKLAEGDSKKEQLVKDFVDQFIKTKDYNFDWNVSYVRRSQEVQARNTARRLALTEEQRKKVSPSSTLDIAGKVQVGGAASKETLPMQVRELRVLKFAGEPLDITNYETGDITESVGQNKVVAGWFEREGDKLIVNLTKAANATTFSHEMFHAFAEVLMEQYNSGSLSKFWARQATNMFESVEAKPDENGKVALTDTQMEHLADQFTTYILEGKIPTAEVSSIFALIKDWFKKAYIDFGIRKLGLNKKVTEVFDSIFMAQEEVEQRQRALGMIEFPMPEGADEGLYNKYVSHLLNSRAKASGKLVRAWYAMQKRRQSQEYIKRRGDIYKAVFGELSATDGYKYKALLAVHNGDHVMTYNDFLAQNPDTLNSDSPMTPDVIREIAEQLPDIEEAAWKETDRRLDEEMAAEFKLDKEPAANKVLRNTEKVKALLAEALLHEGKTLADFDAEYKKFMENAERLIAKLSISEKKNSKGIRNFNYWTNQETMAVERYTYAYANQNKEEMAQQRRNQALFTMIRIRGEEIENRANRFIKQFAEKLRFNQKNEIINKETGERGQLYTLEAWDLLQSVIEKFGFKIATKARINKVVTEKLEDWIKEQEGKSMTTIGFLRNFEPFVGKGYEGEFSKMSVNMFEQLDNIMTAINAVARTEKFVITESEKLHFNELKRDVRDTLKEKGIGPTTKYQTWWGKTFGALGKWTNPEPVLQEFFSAKVLNSVFRPFFTAAAKADTFGNAWIARYRQAREKIKLTGKYKTFSDGTRLTDVQVLDLFLSMGTQHAYENFMMALFKEKNEERAELVVSEALAENPELANFVTEYWNLMSETADAMNESHKKRTNRVLVRKEPRSFTINGIQFAGGYVPENKGLIREISEGDYNSLQMGLLANEKEISKDADGTVKSIVDNTESRLGLFAKWAYAAPEYNNICKFMQDPEIKAMVGEGLTEFVFNWLRSFQTPTIDTSGLVRPLTGLTSISALGFRVMQGLIQLSGVIPALPVVGVNYMLYGLRKTLLTGDIFNPVKHARTKSDYMANRYDNPMESILGFDKKDIKRTKIGNVYQASGMWFITLFDSIVSSAVWEGAKAKALANGMTEQEAIMEADAAVRVSQTDSMAASRSQAMQSPWARMITSFSTYIMGMQSVVRGKLAAGERWKAAQFAVAYIVFSTFFESMFREAVEGDDEDDEKKYIERVQARWYNDMVKTLGSTAIPAFGLGSAVSTGLAKGIEIAATGEAETFESFAPSSAAYSYLSKMYYTVLNLPPALAGDEEAQGKVIVNSVGLVSSFGQKHVKEWINQ